MTSSPTAVGVVLVESGAILPKSDTDTGATETISKLALDLNKLREMRKAAISVFLSEDLTDDELSQFVAEYLRPDSQGNLSPYVSTIEYLFGGANP